MDFSAGALPIDVKFCLAVLPHLRQVFSYFWEDIPRDRWVIGVNRGHMAGYASCWSTCLDLLYIQTSLQQIAINQGRVSSQLPQNRVQIPKFVVFRIDFDQKPLKVCYKVSLCCMLCCVCSILCSILCCVLWCAVFYSLLCLQYPVFYAVLCFVVCCVLFCAVFCTVLGFVVCCVVR